jgi:hypothetical protein
LKRLALPSIAGAFLCLFVSSVALFECCLIKEGRKISPLSQFLSQFPPPFSLLFSAASSHFLVIHLCNEDVAQLTSPLELNKRPIIQTSLAPKDYNIHTRSAVKVTGKNTTELRIKPLIVYICIAV